jgi:hypothetical protein
MPVDISLITVITSAVLIIGVSRIAFLTWKNGQATGSVGQLLARTEKAPNHGEIDPRRFSARDRD